MELNEIKAKFRKNICSGCVFSVTKSNILNCDLDTQDIEENEEGVIKCFNYKKIDSEEIAKE